MRNWSWIKWVVLDVLSIPFFGSIGFCRTEPLGVGGNGKKKSKLFSFSVLAKKSFCV